MTDKQQLSVGICEGVVEGICVVLRDNLIIYAGPIEQSPRFEGATIMMHAKDFKLLKSFMEEEGRSKLKIELS